MQSIVKGMEDHKDNLILILAGYKQEMAKFIQTNPGLKSRFPIHLDFPDYTVSELVSIADLFLARRQYKLSDLARRKLVEMLDLVKFKKEDNKGNARMVRNIIERGIRLQAVRLLSKMELTREELMTIEADDLIDK